MLSSSRLPPPDQRIRTRRFFVGEWWFNETTRELFYWHNSTGGGAPPEDLQLVAGNLTTLIRIVGSKTQPVTDITISGIGIRDAAPTWLERWGVPRVEEM